MCSNRYLSVFFSRHLTPNDRAPDTASVPANNAVETRALLRRLGFKMSTIPNPSIMHQSMFCRRRAFERVGLFDEARLKVAADKDWNVRAFVVAALPSLHVPVIVSASRHGGYSTIASANLERDKKWIEARYFTRAERAYHWAWVVQRRLRLRLATHDLSMPQFLARRVSRWRRRLPAESDGKRDRS